MPPGGPQGCPHVCLPASSARRCHRCTSPCASAPALFAALRLSPCLFAPLPACSQEEALRRAAALHRHASLSAKEGLQGARLVAADLARGEAKAAGRHVGGLLHGAATSPAAMFLARALVCIYFANSVWDSLSTWSFMRQPEVLQRAARWPQHYPPVR